MYSEKDRYLSAISAASGQYGDLLLRLMDEYKAMSLQEISEAQAREFYERNVKTHGQDQN